MDRSRDFKDFDIKPARRIMRGKGDKSVPVILNIAKIAKIQKIKSEEEIVAEIESYY